MSKRKAQLGSGPQHHKKDVVVKIPEWLEALPESEACLKSLGEDAYTAKAFAEARGARQSPNCAQLMRAGDKSMAVLENSKAKTGTRCSAGDRAARKFWEAKVCARAK